MKFTQSQLDEYNDRGYVIVPCPFSRDLTNQCLEAVEKVAVDPVDVTTDGIRNHFRLRPQIPDSYWSLLDHSLPFLQIILHPEILELARQLAGDEDIYLRNGGINELAPDRSFWWHRDSIHDYTEFMHYFSGATTADGCLRVIPGSHIGPIDELNAEVERRRKEQGYPGSKATDGWADVELPGELAIEIDSDQMIVRSSRIFHSTWLNRSDKGRLMNHWLLRDSSVDDHRFRFEEYLTAELLDALTADQKEGLWMGRDYAISERFADERGRELGKVSWGVI